MYNYLSALALITALALSVRKGNLPFALAIVFYLVLTTGQAFYIAGQLNLSSAVDILHATITEEGFNRAQHYSLAVSLGILATSAFGRAAARKTRPSRIRFAPSKLFYVSVAIWLLAAYSVLVIAVVGVDIFVTSSRPGYQEGSTIFIVMLFVGIMPMILQMSSGAQPNRADIALAIASFVMTAAFSRIHCVFYAASILFAHHYGHPSKTDRRHRWRQVKLVVFVTFGIVVFISIGALRDALNFTGASVGEVFQFITENPERSLFSIENNYRVGVEGMSALAGAMSAAEADPNIVHYDFGLRWIIQGLLQWIPGALKVFLEPLYAVLATLNWYSSGIVDPGIMESYRSFGWFGIPVFCGMLYAILWRPCVRLRKQRGVRTRLVTFTLLGLSAVFLVRGSWVVWIGYSITYLVIIAGSWPFFSRQLVRA